MNQKETEQESVNGQDERRAFLKKAVYTAPKLIVLGYLAQPEHSIADYSGGPSGPPGGWNP